MVVNNENEDIDPREALQPDWMDPFDPDWLSKMPCGTEFLCRHKLEGPRWSLMEFTHGGKLQGNVLLCPTATINQPATWKWVDPVEFCKVWELRGVLGIAEEDEHN